MAIKEEIQTFLAKKSVKPYELADLAKVPRTSVYRLLNGERENLMETTADKLRQAMNSYSEQKQAFTEQTGVSAP